MAISLSCGSPAEATVGFYYEHQLAPSGGTAFDYIYTIIGGSLPPGLFLNPGPGTIYGTPTVAGVYAFTAQVVDTGDSSSDTCSATITVVTVVAPLSVSCNNPPVGTVGTPYSHDFIIEGGEEPYSVVVTNGILPPGLFVNNQGTLSGTPNTAGTYGFQLRVFDSGNPARNASAQCFITVNQPAQLLTIACNNPPAGTVGVFYSHTPLTNGGTQPYNITVSVGSLPTGLFLNNTIGTIAGTPTTAGTYNFTLHISDQVGAQNNVSCSIVINASTAALAISCNNPPAGTVATPYLHSVTVTGGNLPYTFSLVSGALPPGLSLVSVNGTITGTPTTVGSYVFGVQVRDLNNVVSTANCAITINSTFLPLAVSCNNPPLGAVGQIYNHSFVASGGHQPYTWEIVSGMLPPGVIQNIPSGVSGIPTLGGNYQFTLRVTDIENSVAQVTCNITIQTVGALLPSCNTPPAGVVGTPYSHTLSVGGGSGVYAWDVHGGALPAGLILTSGGTITGTPTTFGVFPFTARVQDSAFSTAEINCTLTINTAVSTLGISCNTPPIGIQGVVYNHTFSASGGSVPYTYAITAGSLPIGITLDVATGTITGTPLFADIYDFTVQVTDDDASTATVACRIVINAESGLAIHCLNPPNGEVGTPYGHQIGADEGSEPYIFEIIAGTLPTGMFMHTDGFIQGTPTIEGNYSFTVRVRDYYNATAQVQCSISVFPGAVLACNNPPRGKVGVAYHHQIQVPTGFTVHISAGSLPAGLTMSTSGLITGTPTTAGTFNFTILPS